MNERILSKLQKEYRDFFLEKLRLYGVKSPNGLTKGEKSRFFTEIKNDWFERKQAKKRLDTYEPKLQPIVEEKINDIVADVSKTKSTITVKKCSEQETSHQPKDKEQGEPAKLIIKSEPNQDQTDDLRILFSPNSSFEQKDLYLYPVVKMPKQNAVLKLPRTGRSNQKGYKENDFFNQLNQHIIDFELSNNVHMIIPNFSKPYEPDIVLFNKSLNLYIDIEIDEPYDGYYRYPTHYLSPEDGNKKDNVRDLFFTESGWIVIRFTEQQVHCQAYECIDYIKNVLFSVLNKKYVIDTGCQKEDQWDYNQCIQWQKVYYREKYLGIEKFQKQCSYKEIEINTTEIESVENVIHRTKRFSFDNYLDISLAFDENSHKYIHSKDETGNAEYISVTTLIERFFPFDLKRYIERKSDEENKSEEDVLSEYLLMRDEAADKGTFLHKQIECYLKGNKYDPDSDEFRMFLEFCKKEVEPRNLKFYDAEKMIFSDKYNVAGTIDCLFKKDFTDEYVMLDWKRSKKLVIDGRPRMFGYGRALSELSSFDNSSFYKYCLQQNIYKYILETEYSMKTSSMQLVVLHENYDKYYVVKVPELRNETEIILNSLKYKI